MVQVQKNNNSFAMTLKDKYYIDFFSGCGGLSLGLGYAGWNGFLAIEKDPMAFATFKYNIHPDMVCLLLYLPPHGWYPCQ